MITINLTSSIITKLQYLRYNHPHPRVQQRVEVLLLKSKNLPHKEIARLTNLSVNTITSYLKLYQKFCLDGLEQVNFYQPKSDFVEYTATIKEYFNQNPPSSINEAMGKMEELTGLKRSPTQIRKYLLNIGFKFRKVGVIPAKADVIEQKKFEETQLQPRLDEAKEGLRAVFFVDAAPKVWGAFLGYLWSLTRIFIKSPSGRKRFNVLAALNAITPEMIIVTNDEYINAKSVCELLLKIAELNLGIPITLILDNARYQKCQLVQELALQLQIELLYLPPYSPNLNLIERLWKFVKRKVLYSKYYDSFAGFKNAISGCLNQTQTTHKAELDSLITLKFQSFAK